MNKNCFVLVLQLRIHSHTHSNMLHKNTHYFAKIETTSHYILCNLVNKHMMLYVHINIYTDSLYIFLEVTMMTAYTFNEFKECILRNCSLKLAKKYRLICIQDTEDLASFHSLDKDKFEYNYAYNVRINMIM